MLAPDVTRRFTELRPLLPSLGHAALAGLCLAFAAAPFRLVALAFFAAPLFQRSLEVLPGTARPLTGALAVGLSMGVTVHVAAFYWMVPMFVENVGMPFVAAVVLSALAFVAQSLPFVVAATIARFFALCGGRLAIVVPVAIAIAFTRSYMQFPWRPSSTVVEWLPWVQLADVGGEPLLDLLLAASGCALYEALRARNRLAAAVGIVSFVAPLAYGVPRLRAVEAATTRAQVTHVGVVQPNIPQSMKFDRALAWQHLGTLKRITRGLEAARPDFTIWPETAYPFYFGRLATADAPGLAGVRAGGLVRGPILFGAITVGRARCDHRNSVVALDANGRVVGVADKANPLPFGENVPFWDALPFLHGMFPCRGYVSGDASQIVVLEGRRLGILNCYEDILPAYVREVALHDVDFLVNVTNDAWFLDTSEPHLHQMVARLRAIETRRDLVRVVNTGVSSLITATGASAVETRTFVETSLVVTVHSHRGTTFWVRHGDLVTPALEGTLFGLAIALVLRRRAATV